MRSQRPPGGTPPRLPPDRRTSGSEPSAGNPLDDLLKWYRAQPSPRQRLYSLLAVVSGAMLLLYALGLVGVAGRYLLLRGAQTPTPPLRVITLPTQVATPRLAPGTTVTLPPTPTQIPIPAATGTPTPTETVTGTPPPPSPTPTETPVPTATLTVSPTPSSSPTATGTPSPSPTQTPPPPTETAVTTETPAATATS